MSRYRLSPDNESGIKAYFKLGPIYLSPRVSNIADSLKLKIVSFRFSFIPVS